MNTKFALRASPAPCATELALHGLAFLSVGQHPASLFEPRYHAFARDAYGADCCATLEEDGGVLGARMAQLDNTPLHALPAAIESTRALVAVARDPSAQVDGVHRATLDACLARDPEGAEWLLCDLALCARAFEARFEARVRPAIQRACDELEPALAEALAVAPDLARFRVSLTAALGERGRGFSPRWLLTGASGLWSPHGAEHSAVMILHEHAVSTAPSHDYLRAEWHALVTLAQVIERSSLRDAHARWLASLELTSLALHVAREGLVDEADARAIAEAHRDRADRLRSLSRS